MSRAWLAAQIIGIMFGLTGMYVIGEWHIAWGVFLMLFGQNLSNGISKDADDSKQGGGSHDNWVG